MKINDLPPRERPEIVIAYDTKKQTAVEMAIKLDGKWFPLGHAVTDIRVEYELEKPPQVTMTFYAECVDINNTHDGIS